MLNLFTRAAARIYFLGNFENAASCGLAAQLANRRVLLLSGADAGDLRASTTSLAPCFPSSSPVALQANLPVTGFTASSATGEQGDNYDRLVIEFFSEAFREDSQLER